MCVTIFSLTTFSFPVCRVTPTLFVISFSTLGIQSAKTIAIAVNAMVLRNTVLNASEYASLYAAAPASKIAGVIPFTASKAAAVPCCAAAK